MTDPATITALTKAATDNGLSMEQQIDLYIHEGLVRDGLLKSATIPNEVVDASPGEETCGCVPAYRAGFGHGKDTSECSLHGFGFKDAS